MSVKWTIIKVLLTKNLNKLFKKTKRMNIIALICARGNSKGIKNKNLLKFKNTTLIGNAIKQLLSQNSLIESLFQLTAKRLLKVNKA